MRLIGIGALASFEVVDVRAVVPLRLLPVADLGHRSLWESNKTATSAAVLPIRLTNFPANVRGLDRKAGRPPFLWDPIAAAEDAGCTAANVNFRIFSRHFFGLC